MPANASAQTATNALSSAMRELAADDMIVVVFGAGGKANTRTVRVTEVVSDGDSLTVLTTSGKVRCGHYVGGSLRLYGDDVLFNATMQQQCKYVVSITRLGVAN